MRATHLFAAALAGALLLEPSPARGQVSVSITLGAEVGPPIPVYTYSAYRYGPWRKDWRRWTPVVLYERDGRFYRHHARGTRAVEVYADGGDYFMPPRDRDWVGFDRRYDYGDRPRDDDFDRVDAYPPGRVVAAPLAIGVYAADRDGDWRTSLTLWTPITVYEVGGGYYPRAMPGSHAVEVYRYRDRYFLPPEDHDWIGADRRYDYNKRPEHEHEHEDDHGRGRGRGRGRG